MPQYFLKNAWFSPDGRYFEAARVIPTEIPEALVPFLPKSAELSDGASRAKPAPAPMANVKSVGAPTVNSAQIFAQQVSDKEVAPALEPAPAAEPVPVDPVTQAAVDFAEAQVKAEEPVAEIKGKAKRK